MSNIINQILAIDTKYRVEGVTENIYKLSDLQLDKDWQLINSFNPIIIDNKLWYGDYYKESKFIYFKIY
jgi:hypothetical protein